MNEPNYVTMDGLYCVLAALVIGFVLGFMAGLSCGIPVRLS